MSRIVYVSHARQRMTEPIHASQTLLRYNRAQS